MILLEHYSNYLYNTWWYFISNQHIRFYIFDFHLPDDDLFAANALHKEERPTSNQSNQSLSNQIAIALILLDDFILNHQVPIIIPITVLLMSFGLVIGPIISNPQLEQLYVLVFIVAGIIFYVPFIYYKKVLPGMGNYTVLIYRSIYQLLSVQYQQGDWISRLIWIDYWRFGYMIKINRNFF